MIVIYIRLYSYFYRSVSTAYVRVIHVRGIVAGGSSPAMKFDESFGAGDSRLSSRGVSGSRLIMKRSHSKSETSYVRCRHFSPQAVFGQVSLHYGVCAISAQFSCFLLPIISYYIILYCWNNVHHYQSCICCSRFHVARYTRARQRLTIREGREF